MGGLLRIALAQLYSSPEVEGNISQLEEAVHKASKEGCHIIIFPEYYTQGIVADSPDKIIKDNSVQERMKELAKSAEIDIVIGTLVESLPEHGQHPVNAREHKTYNTYVQFRLPICFPQVVIYYLG